MIAFIIKRPMLIGPTAEAPIIAPIIKKLMASGAKINRPTTNFAWAASRLSPSLARRPETVRH